MLARRLAGPASAIGTPAPEAADRVQASVPDLRPVDITHWACLAHPAGNAVLAIDVERNRLKNRLWLPVGDGIPRWTVEQFVDTTRRFDQELGAKRRNSLSESGKRRLADIQNRIVTVDGWIVLAYPAGGESTNCGSRDYHDWHIELVPRPFDHPPSSGDPTAIIAEVTPRTERALYDAGIRIRQIAAYIRQGNPPNARMLKTGAAPHHVRITGYLFWDDQHNGTTDIGPKVLVGAGSANYHSPWRQTAWELHPILRVEVLDRATRGGP